MREAGISVRAVHTSFGDRERSFRRPRGLSGWMLEQLLDPDGRLHPVLCAVRDDPELDLQIRDDFLNIYYRGGNLMEIRQPASGAKTLKARFDSKYIQTASVSPWKTAPDEGERQVHASLLAAPDLLDERDLRSVEHVRRHVGSFALRKAAMRANKKPGRRPKPELEAQQGVVSGNNHSADNNYLICDTEYTFRCESHGSPVGSTWWLRIGHVQGIPRPRRGLRS